MSNNENSVNSNKNNEKTIFQWDNVDIVNNEIKSNHHDQFLFFGHTKIKNDKESFQLDNSDFEKRINIYDEQNGHAQATEEKSEKRNILGKLLQILSDEESSLRLLSSTLVLITFAFVAAGIFYGIEKDTKIGIDKDTKPCDWNYWKCLWLINTIYTTIGYGTLAPCTIGGRVAAVVFAFVGIPLNVWALADVGRLLTRCLGFVWTRLVRRCVQKCKSKLTRKKKGQTTVAVTVEHDERHHFVSNDIPLTFALLATFAWFAIGACFFAATEPDRMNFGDALYFVMISVTTVGFGDVTPAKFHLAAVQFFFIMIGISLFSMVINIVQDKIDALADRVIQNIGKEYAGAQADGAVNMAMDEKAARDHVKQMIKKQKGGGVLQMVMGKNMQNRLVDNYLEKSRKRLVCTQTDNETDDREIMAVADTDHVSVQVDVLLSKLMNTHNRSTQLDWMPTIWRDFDWMKVKHASVDKQKSVVERSSSSLGNRYKPPLVKKTTFKRKLAKHRKPED